ncbi:hypothetical protein [Falsiroseomonas sp.]|nr:hypothetical protein [Falsiroseomonas sp.]MDP3418812.1 hypothetical protein [Falsiroseomonas sp.]
MPSATPRERLLRWIVAPVVSTTAVLPDMDVADPALMQLVLACQV